MQRNLGDQRDDRPRIRKPLEPRHKEVQEQKKREEGFNIYLRGANEERVSDQRKREVVVKGRELSQERKQPRKQWEPAFPQSAPRAQSQLHPDAFPSRKKWSDHRPDEDEYSDSFEEDMEDLPPPEQSEEVIDFIKRADKHQIDILRQSIPNLTQSVAEDDPLKDILHQIRQLDHMQQHRLVELLAEKRNTPKPKPVLHKHVQSKQKRPYSGAERKSSAQHELVLRILSTWGHAYLAGLTEIELFSPTSEKISIGPNLIKARNEEGGSLSNPGKMVNGVYRTEDEKNMWVGQMPAPPACLEVVIIYSPTETLGGIRLWNYNKSYLDSVKGVRDMEIVLDGNLIWSGCVNRGSGDASGDYSTEVPIAMGFKFSSRKDSSGSDVMPEELAEIQKQMELIERPNSVPSWLKQEKKLEPEKTAEEIPVMPLSAASSRRNRSALKLRAQETHPILPDLPIEVKPESPPLKGSKSVLQFKKSSQTSKDSDPEQKVPEPQPDRSKRRTHIQETLKESLASLEYFKLSHLGRITGGRQKLDGTIKGGDLLDQFVNNQIVFEAPAHEEEVNERVVLPVQYQDPLEQFMVVQAKKPELPVQVPNLPKGKVLKFSILSTWGDQHYVGLCGIELFDQLGSLIKFRDVKRAISAVPPDVNILPGYGSDPRTVDNLLDGVNWTCDDLHVWLAPFTAGEEHSVTITLDDPISLSMIRIWNYNKSRIHSARGVRHLCITFDQRTIFRGEVAQAPGRMKEADQFCEYILFSSDEKTLKRIERMDWVKDFEEANNMEIEAELMSTIRPINRPGTASQEEPKSGVDGRPMTSAIVTPKQVLVPKTTIGVTGQRLRLAFLSTWGDSFYMGLTGLELLGVGARPIQVRPAWVDAQPRDMNVIPGYSGDYRTVDKLFDGSNVTTDDHHMWLIPFTPGNLHHLTIDLQAQTLITGIRFWNYNKSVEDTARGVKNLALQLDGRNCGPETGVVLRKAPGTQSTDFGQLIQLPFTDTLAEELKAPFFQNPKFASAIATQTYETPCLPVGYILKLRLMSTWGDVFYIGLNGLEIFDHQGRRLLANSGNAFSLSASPASIQVIPGHERDPRTSDKLVDGVNNTYNDSHMWLAPFANSETYYPAAGSKINEISLTFESRICISYLLLWNYAKTPSRGVKEYEVLMDDILIYKGFLRPAPPPGSGDFACAVLFSGDATVTGSVRHLVYVPPKEQTNVLMFNERKLVSGAQDSKKPELARPSTSVVGK